MIDNHRLLSIVKKILIKAPFISDEKKISYVSTHRANNARKSLQLLLLEDTFLNGVLWF